MDQRLNQIFDLLPNRCPNVFIGGGAAVDLDKAGDIDVWFLKNNVRAAEAFVLANGGKFRADTVSEESENDAYTNGAFNLIGGFKFEPLQKNVQVLVMKHHSVLEVLDQWDISTHMIGYTATGVEVRGTNWTPVTVMPQLQVEELCKVECICGKCQNHMARLEKIKERYGFK